MQAFQDSPFQTPLVNNSSVYQTVYEPVMQGISSLLLLGTLAFQSVFGRPDGTKRSIDSFIDAERRYALKQIVCNVGPDGCHTAGVAPGLIIASPDEGDPPYFFSWARDSSLVLKGLVEHFSREYDPSLQSIIQNFIGAQAHLQGVSNPSGSLTNGQGLGEPKFNVDMTPFTKDWGRPQRDGPALRAIAMMGYAKWLVTNDYSSTASSIIWPVVRNELAYIAQYWNQTGFELWEEVDGSSFFTTAVQHRALVEGSALAKALGTSCPDCDEVAPHILCFQQSFWSASASHMVSNVNIQNTVPHRDGIDAHTILTSIHSFDPAARCDANTFQPCSDRALANLRTVVKSFSFFPINSGIPQGTATAVGRYPEDKYFKGNPWYLLTLATAEQLYDSLYVWKEQGSITITPLSLQFFSDLVPSATTGTFNSGSVTFATITDAVSKYADGFVNIVATYAHPNGSMSEQFDKNSGRPISARDLTWSFAAFLTATSRRAGYVPASWGAAEISVPSRCEREAIVGSYSSATATSFPPSLTPRSCGSVAVTFNVVATTNWGQTIKIVGNTDALGKWNPDRAVALSASQYSQGNPLWLGTIDLKAGEVIQYKYINVQEDGSVKWEVDPDHTYTVPSTCATAVSKPDTWQG